MTKKELFAGWNERMFLDDPAAVAAYCRRNAAISSGWRTRCAGGISSLT